MAIAYLLSAFLSAVGAGVFFLWSGGSLLGAFGVFLLTGHLVILMLLGRAYLRSNRKDAATPPQGEKPRARVV